ncbi:hypothetical protein MNBD_GAMMA04-2208, partial [hydrothermal vent metagenome]
YQTQWQHAFKQFTQLNIPLLEITSDQHPVEQLSRYRVIV